MYLHNVLYRCHPTSLFVPKDCFIFCYPSTKSVYIYLPIQNKSLTLATQELLAELGYCPIHGRCLTQVSYMEEISFPLA